MANNMYRVGDYVYFETSPNSPYLIRRIEELNKTPNGNVEAKVMCFFRRRDLSPSLVLYADRNQSGALEDEELSDGENGVLLANSLAEMSNEDRHRLRHRELFLSRQIETLPATHIRGKCAVTLLNETETVTSYLQKDDAFFYSLVFDPQQKTLLADKGEIRVGTKYQADVAPLLKSGIEDRKMEDLESLVWTPSHNLTDKQIDQFLVVTRSVGTFARALDGCSSVKQPSLHMSAAAASRDVTLFHAMDTLHKCNYDMSRAVCALVPSSGPLLSRDEMEEWSAAEASLFEEALEKYGKDFNDIRQDFLPWKTLKNIVEYYYMWKTTDRYVQQKRVKAVEAESKLKQVYIPNYNKTNPNALTNGKGSSVNGSDVTVSGKPCESCQCTTSSQWYSWGRGNIDCRLCSSCWHYWKKFGGFKHPTKLAKEEEQMMFGSGRVHRCSVGYCGKEYKTRTQLVRHALSSHGISMRSISPKLLVKTRNAFYLLTNLMMRATRRLCTNSFNPRRSSRNPTWPVNGNSVKDESMQKLDGRPMQDLIHLVKKGNGKRSGCLTDVSTNLGQSDKQCPKWMLPIENHHTKPTHIAFPKPPKGPDGSLLYTPVPNREVTVMNSAPSILKRRAYEETNGLDGNTPPPKKFKETPASSPSTEALDTFRLNQLGVNPPPGLTVTPIGGVNGDSSSTVNTPSNTGAIQHATGRAKIATVSRVPGKPKIISWMDAPDDVYFYSTDSTKKLRKTLTPPDLRRAARRPWRRVNHGD